MSNEGLGLVAKQPSTRTLEKTDSIANGGTGEVSSSNLASGRGFNINRVRFVAYAASAGGATVPFTGRPSATDASNTWPVMDMVFVKVTIGGNAIVQDWTPAFSVGDADFGEHRRVQWNIPSGQEVKVEYRNNSGKTITRFVATFDGQAA